MARKKLSDETIAQILAEAAYFGEKKTAEKYQLRVTTIRRWERQLEFNPHLLELVGVKKQAFQTRWAEEAGAFIRQGFSYLHQAATNMTFSAEMIHAIAGAMKIASEILALREVLDARFNGQNRENDSQD